MKLSHVLNLILEQGESNLYDKIEKVLYEE